MQKLFSILYKILLIKLLNNNNILVNLKNITKYLYKLY